jgi:L-ascorbate metabolism protein UlaG (beta-lactamase superfamily)
MKLTYYGHACFGIEFDQTSLLIDPFIRPNPLAAEIDIDALTPDYILITHGHEDHVADALYLAKKNNAVVVSSFEIVTWFAAQGHENGHPMNLGGKKVFDNFSLKYVNAVHSSVLPDGTYGGNPGGFVLSTAEKILYFAGDTALTMDMKLIAEEFSLNAAILPVGDNFTMGYEDAAKAADFINCKRIIGMHFDTFPYIEIDKEKAKDHFAGQGKTLLLPAIGEMIDI